MKNCKKKYSTEEPIRLIKEDTNFRTCTTYETSSKEAVKNSCRSLKKFCEQ